MNPPITTLDAAQRQFPNTLAVIQHGITRGLHLGVQLYVSRELRPVVDLAIGENQPGEALTIDHSLPWLSAGKPMTALAVMQLVEQGLLELDRQVSELIPEFGQQGKGSVTTRHLLTHTAGIEAVALGWPSTSWDEIIARICAAPLKAGAVADRKSVV